MNSQRKKSPFSIKNPPFRCVRSAEDSHCAPVRNGRQSSEAPSPYEKGPTDKLEGISFLSGNCVRALRRRASRGALFCAIGSDPDAGPLPCKRTRSACSWRCSKTLQNFPFARRYRVLMETTRSLFPEKRASAGDLLRNPFRAPLSRFFYRNPIDPVADARTLVGRFHRRVRAVMCFPGRLRVLGHVVRKRTEVPLDLPIPTCSPRGHFVGRATQPPLVPGAFPACVQYS